MIDVEETAATPIPCPICGTAMKLTVTTNRNGKHAIGVHCPVDGRHFRGFINHKPYVAEMLSRLAEAMAGQPATPTSAGEALQNPQEAPKPARSTRKQGAGAMNATKGARRRPGRPRVVDRPGFLARWAEVGPLVLGGEMSHGEAARRLACGFATVLRLIRQAQADDDKRGGSG